MEENAITQDILDAALKLHRRLGPGLLESVCEQLLAIDLAKRGHTVERQKTVSSEYEGVTVENAFRVDMPVDGKTVVELKSAEQTNPVFLKQVKTYLVLMGLQVGLLVNFGMNHLKDGVVRVVNGWSGPLPSVSSPPLRASAPPREPVFPLPRSVSAPPCGLIPERRLHG